MSAREALDFLTNNISSYLLTLPGVSSCSLTSQPPLTSPNSKIIMFESEHGVDLPEDLRIIYECVGDGFALKWYAKAGRGVGVSSGEFIDMRKAVNKFGVAAPAEPSALNETKVSDRNQVLAGNGKINGINDLAPVPIESQIDPTIMYKYRITYGPNYIPPVQPAQNNKIKAFAIDSLPGYGCVCLVYNAGYVPGVQASQEETDSTSIWYIDRSCRWWFVSADITSYLRLMMVHLCIVGWWQAYSDSDLDPGCKLLMRRFAPERMVVDEAFGIRCNNSGEKYHNAGRGGGGPEGMAEGGDE
mmetsp:Transcript_16578/g.34213  ORF Transcript_16578/g.34213 Transcript_16578/m.34213 type:complete len:301 (+) Transcript_16578:100-1002(+)